MNQHETVVTTGICAVLVLLVGAVGAAAQHTVRLDSGFEPDPYIIEANAGGGIRASYDEASGCWGYISLDPDVRLIYDSGSFPLHIWLESSIDTTLVIEGPRGEMHCDDDSGLGMDAYVRFSDPTSGTYNIWIGVYDVDDAQSPSHLAISEFDEPPVGSALPARGSSATTSHGGLPESGSFTVDSALHGYFGSRTPVDLFGFESEPDAIAAVDRIVNASGLRRNFEVRATGDVGNAAAAIWEEERLLLYNPTFMQEMEDRTGNRWSGISIMAHEIGHHLQGHTIEAGGSYPAIELEADEYSGFILRRLGATLTDAQAVMAEIGSERGSDTHPAKSARLTAIAIGWRAGGGADDGSGAEQPDIDEREQERRERERREREREEERRERERRERDRERERERARERIQDAMNLCTFQGGSWEGGRCVQYGYACHTTMGSCPLSRRLVVGAQCWCPSRIGPVYGQVGR